MPFQALWFQGSETTTPGGTRGEDDSSMRAAGPPYSQSNAAMSQVETFSTPMETTWLLVSTESRCRDCSPKERASINALQKTTGMITHLSCRPQIPFFQTSVLLRFHIPDDHRLREAKQNTIPLEAQIQDLPAWRGDGDRGLHLGQNYSARSDIITLCLNCCVECQHPDHRRAYHIPNTQEGPSTSRQCCAMGRRR